MTSNGLCIVWLPATPTLNPVPAALPVRRFDSPPIAVPPGGLLVPGGPTNNCGSITVACATPDHVASNEIKRSPQVVNDISDDRAKVLWRKYNA